MGEQINRRINITTADGALVVDDVKVAEEEKKQRRN